MLAVVILHMVSLFSASAADFHGILVIKHGSEESTDYDAALKFLKENDALASKLNHKATIADWNYASNLTEENKKVMLESQMEAANFSKETYKNATSFAWKDFKNRNETIYRWFKTLAQIGLAALPKDKLNKFNKIIADMQEVYSKAKICPKDNPEDKTCKLSLEPELTDILKKSRDYDELQYVWTEWRKATSKVKPQYLEYVKLSNEVAELNDFKDAGDMWTDTYECETFVNDVEKLLKAIDPLYLQLHAFVRRRLIDQYPDKGISSDGPIPAHLLGDMWAQTWTDIFDVVKPYPEKNITDVSKSMVEQVHKWYDLGNWLFNSYHMLLKSYQPGKILDMFKLSEEFFTSLGLKAMTPEFWMKSIIEKPADREMICHASAWDFSNGKDFRIKMCTKIDFQDLVTVHHEMGHIQYYQQYAHQPVVFRNGANPGFHEAVGDVLALSVQSSKHLKKIKLLDKQEQDDEKTKINGLMKTALQKVPFLPFSYLLDLYRWDIFSGKISEDKLNSKWWKLRLKYQGLCPPKERTDDDFDAASKYHVIANIPYIRYFVSFIIQFQFHEALCNEANHKGPLHQCDIYQNKKAGKLLSKTLRLGRSVHWSEAMKVITRGKTNKMDARPLLEYFEPLMKWLKKQNKGETLGWKSSDPMMCP